MYEYGRKIGEPQNRFETPEPPQEPRPKCKIVPKKEPNFKDVPKIPNIKEFLEDPPNGPKCEKPPLNPEYENKPPQAPVMDYVNMGEKNGFETPRPPQEPRLESENIPKNDPNFEEVPKVPKIKELLEDPPNGPKCEKSPLNPEHENKPPQAPVLSYVNIGVKIGEPQIGFEAPEPPQELRLECRNTPKKDPNNSQKQDKIGMRDPPEVTMLGGNNYDRTPATGCQNLSYEIGVGCYQESEGESGPISVENEAKKSDFEGGQNVQLRMDVSGLTELGLSVYELETGKKLDVEGECGVDVRRSKEEEKWVRGEGGRKEERGGDTPQLVIETMGKPTWKVKSPEKIYGIEMNGRRRRKL